MKYLIILFSVFILLIINSCGDTHDYPFNPDNVYERVRVADNMLKLESYLWRDLMPVDPPEPKPVLASIKVFDTESIPVAKGITADSAWYIKNGESWSGALDERPETIAEDTLYYSNRNGPGWDPGESVDIYVRIKHNNESYFVKAENVEIARTRQ